MSDRRLGPVNWFEQRKPAVLERRAYRMVMIDCPWRWKNYTLMRNWRSPEAKYQTARLDEIASYPVHDLLAPAGFVWAWATWPLMADAMKIFTNGWGLRHVTGGGWTKLTRNGKHRVGTGLVMRGVMEPFAILASGRHGGLRGRDAKNLIETINAADIGGLAREHSRKPEEAYQLIEKLTPGWRRADVFARESRPGWDCWGDEAGKYDGG